MLKEFLRHRCTGSMTPKTAAGVVDCVLPRSSFAHTTQVLHPSNAFVPSTVHLPRGLSTDANDPLKRLIHNFDGPHCHSTPAGAAAAFKLCAWHVTGVIPHTGRKQCTGAQSARQAGAGRRTGLPDRLGAHIHNSEPAGCWLLCCKCTTLQGREI